MTGMAKKDAEIAFPTWNPYLPADMAKPEVRDAMMPAKGYLFLPEGPAGEPCPAMVIAQGLGGPKDHRELQYGRWLAGQGVAGLAIDSFASRGVAWAGDTWRALRVTTAMMLGDAFAAQRHLAGHPRIDPARIGVMGFSYGGMVVMLAAYQTIRRLYLPEEPAFAGHVSYYGCSVPRVDDPTTTGAPILIMLGRKDRNVLIPRVEEIAADLRRGGSEVDLRLFDAWHQWDGDDRRRRHVAFNLRHCAIRVDQNGHLRDENTGWSIDGPLSRIAFLARYTSLKGYDIKRDEEALAASNQALLDFVQGLGAGRS